MIRKLLYTDRFNFYTYLTFFILFFYSIDAHSQCAGNDNILSVCNIADVASKSIDLAALLGPHTAGGTWKDNDFSGGLNVTTGILNAQLITRSGIYSYTYTVNNVVGCTDNSATITVTIGPYAGVGSKGNTCSDDTSYNLFKAFDIAVVRPQINGTWYDDDGSGGLSGNVLNATIPVADKLYHFTYIVSGIVGCPQESKQQVEIYIVPIPEPGTSTNLSLCSNQLSSYTNYNLNNSLSGQDANGEWSQPIGINEISGPTDSTIDIQNIYNTKGPGTYSFSYTVTTDRFCPKSSTVDITIEKKLDFTGTTLDIDRNICENAIPTATYTAVLTQSPKVIADGIYNVTYTISGVATPIVTTQNFVNGVLKFPIASSYFQQVNNYTITILNIVNTSSLGICNNIVGTIDHVLRVNPIPKIDNATLTIPTVCQNADARVYFSGTSNLTDGDYVILYSLSGSNNSNTIPPKVVTVTAGTFAFDIPKALIPKTGVTTVAILKIKDQFLDPECTNTSTLKQQFTVNPLPDLSNLAVAIKDVCQGSDARVELTGLGTLTSIEITYDLSNSNTVPSQIILLTTVVPGQFSFSIPATNIPTVGPTTFTITNVTNHLTGCSSLSNKTVNFKINPIPPMPVADGLQPFCIVDNAKVINLNPQGSQYQWLDSATSTIPLISTTPLVSGYYYVKEVDVTTKCESSSTRISVLLNDVPTPILKPNGQNFCGIDKPTIQSLTNNTIFNGNLTWYDAATNGALLTTSDLLVEGFTYYGFDYSSTTQCYSNALIVPVSLTDCTVTPENFFIPDGFSPNGDGVNDTFQILDIEFLYPNYTLEIFNRYGNSLFKGNISKPAWDGKNSSANFIDGNAPSGVYFYVLHFNKDNFPPKQGQLYLNR